MQGTLWALKQEIPAAGVNVDIETKKLELGGVLPPPAAEGVEKPVKKEGEEAVEKGRLGVFLSQESGRNAGALCRGGGVIASRQGIAGLPRNFGIEQPIALRWRSNLAMVSLMKKSSTSDSPLPPETDPGAGTSQNLAGQKVEPPRPLKGTDMVGVILGLAFWVFVIGGLVWRYSDTGRAFISQWWWLLGVAAGIGFIVGLVNAAKRWFTGAEAEKRSGFVVFVILPIILGGIGAIVLLSPTKQIVILRSVFLIIVCLFPALIYYLFIATRKISLLNDYFINLGRLGLLKPRGLSEDDREYYVRVLSYIQKFEALYGPIPEKLGDAIMNGGDPLIALAGEQGRASASSGIKTIFTTEAAVPVILATVLMALGWLLALPPTGADVGQLGPEAMFKTGFWSVAFGVNEDPVIYAFLGAYFFSLQMLFRRYVREDLRKSAYVAVTLRIILAVIGTWATVTAFKALGKAETAKAYLPVVGFVIGVFPKIAWQFIQGATKALMRVVKLSAVLPSMENKLPVSDLDGLTVWHESRLEEEDIENIPNMATAEIVDLMISTRFPPDRIIDWVDQAILLTHLGPEQKDGAKAEPSSRRHLLRMQGIRTATSLIDAVEKSKARPDAAEVEKIMSASSKSHVQSLLDAIATASNLELICAWRRRTLQTHAAPVPAPSAPSTVILRTDA